MAASTLSSNPDQGKQAKSSCSADNQFIVNLKSLERSKSLTVHPCGCSTVRGMQNLESDPEKRGFASLDEVKLFANSKGVDISIPKQCKMPARPAMEAVSSSEAALAAQKNPQIASYSKETALQLLLNSQAHAGARHHPGDHVPLQRNSTQEMEKRAVARGKPITSFYLSLDDAAEDIAKLLNDNRTKIGEMRQGQTLALENQPLTKERTIGVYSKQKNATSTETARVGTLVLKTDEVGLHIVTFYPEAARRR